MVRVLELLAPAKRPGAHGKALELRASLTTRAGGPHSPEAAREQTSPFFEIKVCANPHVPLEVFRVHAVPLPVPHYGPGSYVQKV